MNRNLHEWYLDVEIILQDGQLEKRLLGIKKCVEVLEKDSDNAIAWIAPLVKLYYGIPVDEETKNSFAEFFSTEDPSFSVCNAQELALLAGATLVALAEDSSIENYYIALPTVEEQKRISIFLILYALKLMWYWRKPVSPSKSTKT